MSASNFRLRVTAGPTYDRNTHTPVPVNTSTPLSITTPHSTTTLHIRLSSFRSSPSSPLPPTHAYFSHPSHSNDLYSFQLSFSPTSDNPISGEDLVWGNDFDKPIRDLLPIGFSVFWNLAKWVDPGLDGDLYSDKPWVWGHVLSSMNVISVMAPGDRTPPESEIDDTLQTEMPTSEEFADGDTVLQEDMTAVSTATLKIPKTAAARKKFFLDNEKKREVGFRKGWKYGFDFFGPWVDFAKFEIKLPGYGLNLLKYWDGQPVRYVLKNKRSGDVYACVLLDFVEVGSEEEEKAAEANKKTTDDID